MDDHRGQLIADVISNSEDNITLNTNTPTRVSNTTLQQTSSSDINTVSNILYNKTSRTTQHALSSATYPLSTYDMTTDYNKIDGHSPTTRKLTGHNSRKTHSPNNSQTLSNTQHTKQTDPLTEQPKTYKDTTPHSRLPRSKRQ